MSERRSLARDPLADLLAPRRGDQADPTPPEPRHRPAKSSGRVARITVQLDDDLAEEGRYAVMWLHGAGVHTTISALAEAALGAEMQRLREEHTDGRRFPPRRNDMPTGRPPKG